MLATWSSEGDIMLPIQSMLQLLTLVVLAETLPPVQVLNTYDHHVVLWVMPRSTLKWESDRPFIESSDVEEVSLTNSERFYLMVKDTDDRERHLGWYPKDLILKGRTPAALRLGVVNVNRSITVTREVPTYREVTETYNVTVYQREERTRRVYVNGRLVEQTYTVLVPTTETRERTRSILEYETVEEEREFQVAAPAVFVNVDGQMQGITGEFAVTEDAQKELGIRCHKCDIGIHIDFVRAGGPAENCWDASGKVWRIERGDHLLKLNGLTLESVAHLQQLLRSDAREFSMLVLDRDGRTRRRLTCVPE